MINNNADGFSYYHPGLGRFIIRYNDVQCIERQRFTIMHEIGHILLGHKTESDLADKMANYFAAYALAPSPLIHEYGVEDYIDIKNIFQVSEECAQICMFRYNNWVNYGCKHYLPYEKKLIDMFNFD